MQEIGQYGALRGIGQAEIEPQRMAEPVEILNRDRAVEAEQGARFLQRLGVGGRRDRRR